MFRQNIYRIQNVQTKYRNIRNICLVLEAERNFCFKPTVKKHALFKLKKIYNNDTKTVIKTYKYFLNMYVVFTFSSENTFYCNIPEFKFFLSQVIGMLRHKKKQKLILIIFFVI